jgi:peptidoglycan hydrolase CwlO-like protein
MIVMRKKLGLAVLILVAGLFVAKKTNFCSYVSTAWAKFKKGAKNQVPLEFEIERVRTQIAKLDEDVRDQLGPIAEDMASIKELGEKIKAARENLAERKTSLLALSRELKKGSKLISYRDEEYTTEEARSQLALDFAAYKRDQADLKSQENILVNKKKAVRAVRQQLSAIRTLKRDLEVQVARLEAELKAVRLAQTRDKYQLDDTRLSDIKQSLAEIQHRLDVESEKTKLNELYQAKPTPRKKVKPTSQLTREVETYFGEEPSEKGKNTVKR